MCQFCSPQWGSRCLPLVSARLDITSLCSAYQSFSPCLCVPPQGRVRRRGTPVRAMIKSSIRMPTGSPDMRGETVWWEARRLSGVQRSRWERGRHTLFFFAFQAWAEMGTSRPGEVWKGVQEGMKGLRHESAAGAVWKDAEKRSKGVGEKKKKDDKESWAKQTGMWGGRRQVRYRIEKVNDWRRVRLPAFPTSKSQRQDLLCICVVNKKR